MPRDSDWFDHLVVAESKLVGYLLSPTHPRGRHKSMFYVSLGFSQERPQTLEQALIRHAHTAIEVAEMSTRFGVRWVLRGRLPSPDGRDPDVQVIWHQDVGSSQVRFVTAYPVKRSD
jgi:hypothetical protein